MFEMDKEAFRFGATPVENSFILDYLPNAKGDFVKVYLWCLMKVGAGEAFTVEEALQLYTSAGAYASYEEDFKGQIKPGMAADFVILDRSPFDVPAQEIHRIRTLCTFLGGKCVYCADCQ